MKVNLIYKDYATKKIISEIFEDLKEDLLKIRISGRIRFIEFLTVGKVKSIRNLETDKKIWFYNDWLNSEWVYKKEVLNI